MVAIPPVGAAMPPVVSQAAPAATGASAAGDQLQALFQGLNFAELEGQFFSGPELLGALGAQGNATLRDFLSRLKKADASLKAVKSKMSNPEAGNAEAGDTAAPLHGGPAREPFEREGSTRSVAKAVEMMEQTAEFAEAMAEMKHFATLALRTTSGINE